MKLVTRTTMALAAMVTAAASPRLARADIEPIAGTPMVTSIGNGEFQWDYTVNLTAQETLNNTDFFIIYDFGPALSITMPSAAWSFTAHPTNPGSITIPNLGTVIVDQSSALNYMFTYNGPSVAGPQPFTFSLVSTSGTKTDKPNAVFLGRATDNDTGEKDVNLNHTFVPVATPEPASVVLLGTGMLGLVGVVRRRTK